jgi:hypothetical protein
LRNAIAVEVLVYEVVAVIVAPVAGLDLRHARADEVLVDLTIAIVVGPIADFLTRYARREGRLSGSIVLITATGSNAHPQQNGARNQNGERLEAGHDGLLSERTA